jgi:hypothetical protein
MILFIRVDIALGFTSVTVLVPLIENTAGTLGEVRPSYS